MIGMVLWTPPEKGRRNVGIALQEQGIVHMRILCARVLYQTKMPEPLMRRRVIRALKKLQRNGVRRVILPENFPWQEELERLGLQAANSIPLRRLMAADWVRTVLPESSARVAVFAAKMSPEVVRTVTELALRHRYVLLTVPGGEALCRELRRDYGVSLLLNPAAQQLMEAEVMVCFDPPAGKVPLHCLEIYDTTKPLPPLILPPVLEEQLPEGADRETLAAVLLEAGVLRPGQITLGREKEARNR